MEEKKYRYHVWFWKFKSDCISNSGCCRRRIELIWHVRSWKNINHCCIPIIWIHCVFLNSRIYWLGNLQHWLENFIIVLKTTNRPDRHNYTRNYMMLNRIIIGTQTKLDVVGPLITDPPTTRSTNLSPHMWHVVSDCQHLHIFYRIFHAIRINKCNFF